MKKVSVVALAVLVTVAASGCMVGPNNFSRGIDDWANQSYGESPWLYGNVISGAIISIVMWVAHGIDSLINIYWFWAKDAQPFGTGKGTTFTHKNPMAPAGK